MRAASKGLRPNGASPTTTSAASIRRSGSTSMRYRPPRSRSRSSVRSRRRCARRLREAASMKFGPVSPREAEGATAVHTIRQGSLVLKKGTLVGPAEVAALEAAGIKDIVVARLEPGDVSEDKAAAEIAKAVAGEGV